MRSILLLTAFLLTRVITAQEIVVAHEDDKVKVEYTISQVKKKGEMLGEIKLIITNKTSSYIEVDFVGSLFHNMVLAEATHLENLCVNPKQIKKGKLKGLFYRPESLSYEQLLEEDFELYIEDLKIKNVSSCK